MVPQPWPPSFSMRGFFLGCSFSTEGGLCIRGDANGGWFNHLGPKTAADWKIPKEKSLSHVLPLWNFSNFVAPSVLHAISVFDPGVFGAGPAVQPILGKSSHHAQVRPIDGPLFRMSVLVSDGFLQRRGLTPQEGYYTSGNTSYFLYKSVCLCRCICICKCICIIRTCDYMRM